MKEVAIIAVLSTKNIKHIFLINIELLYQSFMLKRGAHTPVTPWDLPLGPKIAQTTTFKNQLRNILCNKNHLY